MYSKSCLATPKYLQRSSKPSKRTTRPYCVASKQQFPDPRERGGSLAHGNYVNRGGTHKHGTNGRPLARTLLRPDSSSRVSRARELVSRAVHLVGVMSPVTFKLDSSGSLTAKVKANKLENRSGDGELLVCGGSALGSLLQGAALPRHQASALLSSDIRCDCTDCVTGKERSVFWQSFA